MRFESDTGTPLSRWIETLALWVSIPLFLLAWQAASISGYVNELVPTADQGGGGPLG